MYTVYVILNKVNGKMYVGKDKKFPNRWKRDHLRYAKGGKEKHPHHYQYIHAAINKYGVENFELVELERFETAEECSQMEIFWIAFWRTWDRNYGYNLTRGGEGAHGRVVSEETKRKMSEAKKGKYIGGQNPFFGKKHTVESKLEIGRKSKGRSVGENSPHFGEKMPQETRNKISGRRKGKFIGKNNPFYGKTHTPETIKMLSEINAGENHPQALLTNRQVEEIRREMREGAENKELAEKHHIDPSIISRIRHNKTYKV